MPNEKFDFSGYATKHGIVCSDGRTIARDAFAHMDGQTVPLVWHHLHDEPTNVLGHAVLEARDGDLYAYGYFNDTPNGQHGKSLVMHKDVVALSIYANRLIEKSKLVHSGQVREVSLVLSGANPGAKIDFINLLHNDGSEDVSEEEAIITSGVDIELQHEETKTEEVKTEEVVTEEVKTEEVVTEKVTEPVEEAVVHAEDGDTRTVKDVFDTYTDEQKKLLYALIQQALNKDELSQSDTEGDTLMKKNVFENTNDGPALSHEDATKFATAVFNDMQKNLTFKEAFMAHAGTYGIDNISYLFPDAQATDQPSFYTRRMGWVQGWMNSTRHTPFSRIKKVWADLTPDAARAKGYITGNEKAEQVFALLKRTTEPTTVYKKQKLDRDDIVDIIDFDVVAWMWREMAFMLEEEIARAALIGDGRVFGVNDDAIDPTKVRPILGDSSTFVHYLTLDASVTDWLDVIDAILNARINYKGKGTPNLYVPNSTLMGMLLLKDTTDHRLYKGISDLAAELRVAEIIEVDVMTGVQRVNTSPAYTADLLGIMVNPADYTYGTDKGGKISTFDDFDIDFNQQKYLIETRLSGSLLEPKSAMVIERKTA
jgi:hypothetical protein